MFWPFTIISLVLISAIMGTLFWMAKEVPDKAHVQRRFKLNPEIIRAIAYVVMILICLLAAMYEMSLYEDMPEP